MHPACNHLHVPPNHPNRHPRLCMFNSNFRCLARLCWPYLTCASIFQSLQHTEQCSEAHSHHQAADVRPLSGSGWSRGDCRGGGGVAWHNAVVHWCRNIAVRFCVAACSRRLSVSGGAEAYAEESSSTSSSAVSGECGIGRRDTSSTTWPQMVTHLCLSTS